VTEEQIENEQDEFEYNDGLGDLLREKERREFSWLKTIIVLITFIFVIFFCLTFLFNLSKSIFLVDGPGEHRSQELESSTTHGRSFEEQIAQIEKENMALIGDIDDYLKEEEKSKATSKTSSKKSSKSSPVQAKKVTPKPVNTTSTDSPNVSKSALPHKVIAGSFTTRTNANALAKQLKNMGVDSFIYTVEVKGTTYYRVQAGAFKTSAEAKQHVADLKTKSIDSYIITK